MVVGEGAVRVTVEPFVVKFESVKNSIDDSACHTVSTVDDDFFVQAFECCKLFDHKVDVRGFDIDVYFFCIVPDFIVGIGKDGITKRIDICTKEWCSVDGDFETIVLGRIVRTGDHNGSIWRCFRMED